MAKKFFKKKFKSGKRFKRKKGKSYVMNIFGSKPIYRPITITEDIFATYVGATPMGVVEGAYTFTAGGNQFPLYASLSADTSYDRYSYNKTLMMIKGVTIRYIGGVTANASTADSTGANPNTFNILPLCQVRVTEPQAAPANSYDFDCPKGYRFKPYSTDNLDTIKKKRFDFPGIVSTLNADAAYLPAIHGSKIWHSVQAFQGWTSVDSKYQPVIIISSEDAVVVNTPMTFTAGTLRSFRLGQLEMKFHCYWAGEGRNSIVL